MTSKKWAVSLIGAAALALTACTSGAEPGSGSAGGELADGKTFTMTTGTDPGSLDPGMTVLSAARGVGRFLYGRLVDIADDGKVTGALAEKWDADTTKATFTLREGLTCGDGSELTATTVADNLNFAADPANKSPLLGLQVQPGTVAKADDQARTVTVTSGAPDAFLLYNLGSVPMVCADGLADRKLAAKGEAGTGMFELVEAVPNDRYRLALRKDYWNADQTGLPVEVVIRVIPNETTAANLLLSGEVNAATIAGSERDRLESQDLYRSDQPVPAGQLYFNQSSGRPGAEESVRRALTQALDLEELRKVLTSGEGTAPTSLVSLAPNPCDVDTVTGKLPDHDTAAAEQALDTAGWAKGDDGVRVKDGKRLTLKMIYLTNYGETMAATAELVQQAWKELGVELELKGVDNPGLGDALFNTGDWDVSAGPVSPTLPSQLVPFYAGPMPPTGTNFAHVENEEYAAHVKKAASQSGTDGCDDWAAAETALLEAVDVVPYANTTLPTFGKASSFSTDDGIDPASIRMYE